MLTVIGMIQKGSGGTYTKLMNLPVYVDSWPSFSLAVEYILLNHPAEITKVLN